MNKKTHELKTKLASLHAQAADLESQVEELDVSIEQTSSSIDTLKSTYASGVVRKYLNGTYRTATTDRNIFSDPNESAEQSRSAYLKSHCQHGI